MFKAESNKEKPIWEALPTFPNFETNYIYYVVRNWKAEVKKERFEIINHAYNHAIREFFAPVMANIPSNK